MHLWMSRVVAVLFGCTLFSPALCWTPKASLPTTSTVYACETVGSKLVQFGVTPHVYEPGLDAWATVNSLPVGGAISGAAVVGGDVYVATPISMHCFTLDTGVWTTKTSPPLNGPGLASDKTQSVFAIGSTNGGANDRVYTAVYDVVTGLWTRLRDSSHSYKRRYSSGVVVDDVVYSYQGSSSAALMAYTIPTDSWAVKAFPPFPVSSAIDNVDAVEGTVYALGGTTNIEKFMAYDTALDTWEIRGDDFPVTSGTVRVSILGTLLFGVHSTGVWAQQILPSMLGDPVVTTFDGTESHVDLWPGVFNLLTTPTLLVNAAVDLLPSLPVEENLVVTMLGIVVLHVDGIEMIDCTAGPNWFECSQQALNRTLFTPSSISISNDSAVVLTPAIALEIAFQRQHVALLSDSVATSHGVSLWLDVHMRPRHSHFPRGATGLLVDAGKTSLVDYEATNGCLFSPIVKASMNLFDQPDLVNALACPLF